VSEPKQVGGIVVNQRMESEVSEVSWKTTERQIERVEEETTAVTLKTPPANVETCPPRQH
jgi:hypothetical protein